MESTCTKSTSIKISGKVGNKIFMKQAKNILTDIFFIFVFAQIGANKPFFITNIWVYKNIRNKN